MNKDVILISENNLSECRKEIAVRLKEIKLSAKEITVAQLLLEETFFRMKKGMADEENFSVSAVVRRIWDGVELRLTSAGVEYNPIPEVTEQLAENDDEDDAYRLAILKANRQKMNFVQIS